MDLFSAARKPNGKGGPLATRMRPERFEDFMARRRSSAPTVYYGGRSKPTV